MDIEIINILKKHGCLYMADDYKELLTDIQEHYKQSKDFQLLQLDFIKSICRCGVHSVGKKTLTNECGTCGKLM